jgi:hypothetical protein
VCVLVGINNRVYRMPDYENRSVARADAVAREKLDRHHVVVFYRAVNVTLND